MAYRFALWSIDASWALTWVCVLGGLFLLPYVVTAFHNYVRAPLRTRSGQRWATGMVCKRVELAEFPDYARDWFARCAEELAAYGFTAAAHVRVVLGLDGMESYTSLWLNRASGVAAQLLWARSLNVPAAPDSASKTRGFATEFEDGELVLTSDSSAAGVMVPDPKCRRFSCPPGLPLEAMYRLHVARAARLAAGRRPFFPPPGEEIEHWVIRSVKKDFDRQVAAGYYRLDEGRGGYWPTLKGAYLMTWKLLWPWKQIRLRGLRREAQRELKALGFENIWKAVSAPVPAAADAVAVNS